MKLEFSRQIFEKYSDIKFNENPPYTSCVVLCRWKDGRTEKTNLIDAFSQFYEGTKTQIHGASYKQKEIGLPIKLYRLRGNVLVDGVAASPNDL